MLLGAVTSVADLLGSFEHGLPCFTVTVGVSVTIMATVGDMWQSLQIVNTVWNAALVKVFA